MLSNNFVQIMHNSFSDFVGRFFEVDVSEVSHYTPPQGLISIIENQELWFGNINNVNDIAEIDYAIDNIIIPEINSYNFKNNGLKDKLINLLKDVRERKFTLFTYDNSRKYEQIGIFAFCISKRSDSPLLWNLYSKNDRREGYSISFDFEKLVSGINNALQNRAIVSTSTNSLNQFRCGKIIYNPDEQKRIVNDYLSSLECNLVSETEETQEMHIKLFTQFFLIIALFMKDPDFEKEEEIRLLVMVDENEFKAKEQRYPKLIFNATQGIITSRLAFQFSKDAINSINISPYMNANEAEKNLKYFLGKHDLDNVDVITSIPKMR